MQRVYRSEIDGLRALAVLPVVLFHAGFLGMPGGFVGVDVFFVISGFLITGILAKEAREGHLSIAAFYERRIRRIAPALLFVLVSSTVVAFLLLFPDQLIDFAKSLIAAEVFASNIWFWRTSGYFAAQGGILPLLHTWSLAVEEQFYLFIPILILLLGRRGRSLRIVIVVLAILSFAASVFLVPRMPGVAFYLIPTRAWELLLGSIVALKIFPEPQRHWVREGASWSGLALIIASIFMLNEKTAFPGLAALPATFGSALFIWAADDGTAAGRVMGGRLIVSIGLISYSLYLWHWPIIIFTRQYLGAELGIVSSLFAVGLSLAAAMMTYKWIELPTRNRAKWSSRTLVKTSFAAAISLAAVSVITICNDGFSQRFSPAALMLKAGGHDYSQIATRCGLTSYEINDACHIGAKGITFLLVGDSHAGGVAEALDVVARQAKRGGVLSAYNACPGLYEWKPTAGSLPDRQGCMTRNKIIFERLKNDRNIDTIIIANYWPPLAREGLPILRSAVRRTVEFGHSVGKRVIILHGIPEIGYDVPWALAVASTRGRLGPPAPVRPQQFLMGMKLRSVDLGAYLCPRDKCLLQQDGRSLYVDGNHISSYASRTLVAPALLKEGLFE